MNHHTGRLRDLVENDSFLGRAHHGEAEGVFGETILIV
jgi:hypothetical protein